MRTQVALFALTVTLVGSWLGLTNMAYGQDDRGPARSEAGEAIRESAHDAAIESAGSRQGRAQRGA